MRLELDDLINGYVDVAHAIRSRGLRVAPRGQATRECLGTSLVVRNPKAVLPIGVGRNVNRAIAAAEALQLLGGVSDPALMGRIAPSFNQFRDSGVFHGAYGPRVRAQIPRIVKRLESDRYSRQALINIWSPAQDLFVDGLHDYPCTIMLQYAIRDDKLTAHTYMRSNDVFWGLAYDAFQFTQLQLTIAYTLGVEAGTYYHNAMSMHVYERDFDAIDALEKSTATNQTVAGLPTGLHYPTIDGAMRCARDILDGDTVSTDSNEAWFQRVLAKHL